VTCQADIPVEDNVENQSCDEPAARSDDSAIEIGVGRKKAGKKKKTKFRKMPYSTRNNVAAKE